MAKVDWLGPMRPPIDHCPNIPPLRLQDRREVGPPAQDILSARRVERRSSQHEGSDIPGSPDLLRLLNGGFDGKPYSGLAFQRCQRSFSYLSKRVAHYLRYTRLRILRVRS